MPVFDGKTRVITRVSIEKDAWRAHMGILSRGGSPPERALVHGDRELRVEGNQKSVVNKNRTLITVQNYTCIVRGDRRLSEFGNLDHLTVGRVMRTVTGPSLINHIGIVNATYVQTVTEVHCSPRNISEPTTWFESVQQALKQYNINLDACFANMFLTVTDLNLKASAFGLTVLGYEDTKVDLKKEDAKVVINAYSYTQIVSVRANITALFLSSGTTVSALKMAANSYAM